MPNVIAGKNSITDLYEEVQSVDGRLQVDALISGGATDVKQDEQTAHLAAIETAVEQIGVTRYVAITNWVSKIAFLGVAASGITIQNFRVIDLSTSGTVSSAWTNLATGLDLASAPVVDTEIEYISGTAVTLAEMQSIGIATQTTLAAVLTELQLKADLTETQPVGATARVCVSHQPITAPITTGVTLASLCSGGIIPVGAVTCEIQALNGTVSIGLQSGVTVTPTTGMRLNVDDKLVVDSVLVDVTVVAEFGAASCSAAFFDKV